MAHWNGPIQKEDYQKAMADYQDALNALENMKEDAQLMEDNSKFPYDFKISNIERSINNLSDKATLLDKQFNCKHKNTTGLVCTGHDSHKDHFENKCNDCGLIIEWDMY